MRRFSIEYDGFTEKLERILSADRISQKWLIAPSLRTGYQWLDRLTRSSVPLMNVHVRSLREVALSIAAPELISGKLKYAGNIKLECAIAAAFGKLSESGDEGYLTSLTPDTRLLSALRRTLSDIRLAGLDEAGLPAEKFEVALKGEEIKSLLRTFKDELSAVGWCDYATVLNLATESLQSNPGVALKNVSAIIISESEFESLTYLESRFWLSFPVEICRVVRRKRPEDKQAQILPDVECLAWLDRPQSAPKPARDSSVRMFHSVGEVNGVQEVFRRILADRIPFDNVELIHANPSVYLPLLYEEAFKLRSHGADEIPVTFSEGIPAAYFSPVRALSFWLDWIENNYPQKMFSGALREGLLNLPLDTENIPGFQRIAAALDESPIGFGRERYDRVLGKAIGSLRNWLDGAEKNSAAYGETEEKLKCLTIAKKLAAELIGLSELNRADANILNRAEKFLKEHARSVGLIDNYAHKALLEKIRELAGAYGESSYSPLHDELLVRIREAIAELRIQGLGPRPGQIFVSPLAQGGQSGRPVTYLIGMDEANFPGANSQDPLFLDSERARISERLITSDRRSERTQNRLISLLRGLNGKLTISYCSRAVEDERETSASIAYLSAYRIVSGKRGGDYSDLLGYLGPPVSFVPFESADALTVTQGSAGELVQVDDENKAVAFNILNRALAAGHESVNARRGNSVTPFDGYVPAAGENLFDGDNPPVFSASALETASRSPHDYFFRYILRIQPPEPIEPPSGAWLRNDHRGLILHEVYSAYYRTLFDKRGELTPQAYDRDLAHRILHDTIERFIDRIPPARGDLVSRDIRDLENSVDIFLAVERDSTNQWRPCYFETSVGLASEQYPSALDSLEPAKLDLGDGITIRLRGRIDRVDIRSVGNLRQVMIWDYKTGSAGKYKKNVPYDGGRKLQGAVYPALIGKRIKEVLGEDASLYGFGYYLASDRGDGAKVEWELDQLSAGKDILKNIALLLKNGVFIAGEEPPEPKWNELYDAYQDAVPAAAKTETLLGSDNPLVAPLKKIRELGAKIDTER